MEKVLPRIHIIFSKNSSHSIIFRRGPSKKVCLIGWNRSTDDFQIGQWYRGRIYERRSDISPDGNFIIYFALNGQWESETGGSYTVISRYPYLKAIDLWTKGDGWNGGGLFIDNKRVWLNKGPWGSWKHLINSNKFKALEEYKNLRQHPGECLNVYFPRLARDGWSYIKKDSDREKDVWEKRINNEWLIRKICISTINHPIGKGCYFDEHEIVNLNTNSKTYCKNWEWADYDNKYLYWVENGCLYKGVLDKEKYHGEIIHNFKNYEYKRINAPY